MKGLRNVIVTSAAALLAAACADGVGPAPTKAAADLVPLANTPVSGAAFTTVNENVDGTGHCKNGNPNVNCNIYDGKQFVWLTGGPATAALSDGAYFFAVLEPGGQGGNQNPNDGTDKNLSDLSPTTNTGAGDLWTNRVFTISNGVITYTGNGTETPHDFANNKIRLMPYDDTPNPGGVYILAICNLADRDVNATNPPGVSPSDCKYDAFKVSTGEVVLAKDLTLFKTAAGAYDDLFKWTIQKAVDKTLVKQVGGTATFTYTVNVTHDAGTVSNIKVSGTITVSNLNVDASSNPIPAAITGVTDALPGAVCTVTNGGAQTLTLAQTSFDYVCTLSALPVGPVTNTATVTWTEQLLPDGSLLKAGSATWSVADITLVENQIDETITVTDTFNGTTTTIGTATVGGPNPASFTYQRVVTMPAFDCVSYTNTAVFTTNDTQTSGSAQQTITVCGPAKTGALTMGFWQNKNGQAIIAGGASTSGVCNSATWLRQFAPYQDLSATASCSQVASYVFNIIKLANASGSSMNAMLKAQMLATALDVYFSNPALGGNKIGAPAPIGGVSIDLTMICTDISCTSYENSSSVFGGSPKTVMQMLTYAASQSDAGGLFWYGNDKPTQELAKDAFDAINNQKAFGA